MELRSRLVKTEKVIAGKVLKFVGIKRDLIMMSRWVLNVPVGVYGKGIFDCQIYRLFIMLCT